MRFDYITLLAIFAPLIAASPLKITIEIDEGQISPAEIIEACNGKKTAACYASCMPKDLLEKIYDGRRYCYVKDNDLCYHACKKGAFGLVEQNEEM